MSDLFPKDAEAKHSYCLAELKFVVDASVERLRAVAHNGHPEFKEQQEHSARELERHKNAILSQKFWSPVPLYSYSLMLLSFEKEGGLEKHIFKFIAYDEPSPVFEREADDESPDESVLALYFETLAGAPSGQINNCWARTTMDYQDREEWEEKDDDDDKDEGAEGELVCQNCQKVNEEGSLFCADCGTRLR